MEKFFSLLAILFLLAGQAHAAITSVGAAGEGNSQSSGTTLAFAPSATLEVDSEIVCVLGLDNTATTDGTTSEISSITDTGSNTWAFLAANRNGQAGAAAGIQAEIWRTKITTELTTGSTITVTLANTRVGKSASCWEFTVTSGNSLQIAGSPGTSVNDAAADPSSVTVGSLSSKEYVWVRSAAAESRVDAYVPTSTWTEISEAGSAGCDITDCASVVGDFIIQTGTTATSSLTRTTAGNRDFASVMVALEEYTVGGGATCSGGLMMMGVGC